ncbi:hypothetical protein GCK72_020382 [Caenorhabditis remanei]|uniref:T20D4.11-like domain-containing protein n=1 Tax=Caenorhabditis remanei TaxID=31234 RepID=A0A6A5GGX8_CAERE|nr:hypothetical protein GCK72_020382 [Caenorhabditis remanei]KAF1753825.1 hypothetical protein GCK72_020382 [Caenorhabditis remanei]
MSSENASLLTINATVGIGGTLAPHVVENATTPSLMTTVGHAANPTVPPAMTTAAPAHSVNATVPSVVVTTVAPLHALNVTVPAVGNATLPPLTTVAPLHALNVTVPPVTTIAPAHGVNATVPVTTVAPLHALNVTVPPVGNATVPPIHAPNATMLPVTTSAPGATTKSALNSTMTTPKASTKFPQHCQSMDTLFQSGECYYALEGIDAEIGSMSLTDTVAIDRLNGYCETFSTCYPAIEKCADFDPYSISILKGFCDFYQFVTSRFFLNCARDMEGLDTPCTDNATETILNFNGTTAVKCAKLTAVSSCSVEEVNNWCNLRAKQNYEMFINRHIQEWMC